mgnify:CR=1 FL=1
MSDKEWSDDRQDELTLLIDLINDAVSLDRDSGVIEKLARMDATAQKLSRNVARDGSYRRSFILWLVNLSRGEEQPK